ncbi:MAG: cation:proton antiporter [Thermodesulfobacteriota bacterium]
MLNTELSPLFEEIVYHRSSTLNLLLVMVIIWTTGVICRRIKQPPLLGELLAGIIFGPSLLGIIRPDDTLNVLAELGVFFLMFYAGLESNISHLQRFKKPAIQVGLGGYLVPFLSGYFGARACGLSIIQSLFIGQALSITAIAVSARVLHDMNFTRFRIAPVIMGAGVIDDIIALTVFTIIVDVAVKMDQFQFLPVFLSLIKVIVFFLVSYFVGRWLFPIVAPHLAVREAKGFSFALIVALLFGFWAEISGLHIIIGAYIAGLFVRLSVPSKRLFVKINDRFVSITYGFLGPIFFFCLSFHVTFDVLTSHWMQITLLLFVAISGKFIGSFIGARIAGLNKGESSVVGLVMNGRGAVELIIASVGMEVGIIDDTIFSILVFIAFITTLVPPISLRLVYAKVLNRLVLISPSTSAEN